MPISRSYLKNLCANVQTYFKGASYYTGGRVKILKDTPTDSGARTIYAEVRGIGATYHTNLVLAPDGSRLESYSCGCQAFASYDGVCKHIVALALSIDDPDGDQMCPGAPAAKTDNEALLMLRRYARGAMLDVTLEPKSTGGVTLTPTLELNAQVACASFKIGIDRMYVLKNLAEFVRAISRGENYSYGKNLSFVHCLSAFEPQSAALAKFVSTYYDVNNIMYSGGSCYYGSANRFRTMFLPPFMLDAFMALYEGRSILIETAHKSSRCHVQTENPRLRLQIEKHPAGGYLVQLAEEFLVFSSADCIYLVVDFIIYRCDAAFSAATRELFLTLASAGKHQLFVADSDMPVLATTLLPALGSYLHIISNGELSAFQPPPLQSRVYFDMPEPELVTARLEHHYGGTSHPGFRTRDIRRSLDLRGEIKLESLMLRYLKPASVPGTLCIQDDEQAFYELAYHGASEIAELAEVFATDAFKTMRVKPPAAVSVGVRVVSDLLRLHFDVQGMDMTELEQVLSSYRKAKKYHRLRDGSFLSLEDSSLSEFSELAQGLDLSAREIMSGELSIPKYRALHLDALLKSSERLQYDRDGAFKQIVRDVRDVSDADYRIPHSLRHVLRNYQKTGYRWLRTIAAYGFGGILADDMGLGKTLQVIALLLAQKEEQPEHSFSLVVCPSSLVLNWESEVQKFAPELNATAVTGTATQREELIRGATDTTDLFITSYDSLKRDAELYEGMHFQYLVADEAQYMKNQNTQNAKAVKTLQAAARLALTGTPVENSLAEVWSIFDFLMPGYLYHYAKFRKSFETPIVKQSDEGAAKNLRKMVAPFILRRMKRDVLRELPEKIETVLYAELTGEQRKIYIASAAAAKKVLQSGLGDSGADKLQILALLTRLRQLCCDPALVYEDYGDGSAKLELCLELLQNCIESGHRVLLFSQFTSMLSRISDRLDAAKTPYFTITGETRVSDRLELVNSFNSGDTPIFLISLKAGGTGLNLTGADVVIHYDPWWNSSAQNQASDRAHRIGQTKTVQVYKLIAKDTLEERILEMQKRKSDLSDMIVREGDGAFARMSKGEILELFE